MSQGSLREAVVHGAFVKWRICLWTSPSTTCERSLGNEDLEGGSPKIRERIFISTEALPCMSKSELTGGSEEPSISSLQKGTAKEYSLKNIWEAISYMQPPPLWLHRQESLVVPGTLVVSRASVPKMS